MTGDPCENGGWAGVQCRLCPFCEVVTIDLDNNNLWGTFPNGVLKDLPDLEVLRLQGNSISGTFPNELENTPNLYELRLGNSHTGDLPDYWTKHPETYRNLYFYGPFSNAAFPPFDTLTTLEEYHLQSTNVQGSIPSLLMLTNIKTFVLWNNDKLTGSIPTFSTGPTGQFTKLVTLKIHSNNLLTGTIPDFTDMTVAEHLQIDEQREVFGTVPPLNTMTRLRYFDLSHNRLVGQVPPFSPLVQPTLESIFVEDNFLQGMEALAPNPTPLNALTDLTFYRNLMTGTLPCHQTAYPLLERLQGWENRLTGTLPCLDNFRVIEEYSLSDNDFSGTIPDKTVAPGLVTLKVSNNILTGSLAQGFVNALYNVVTFHIGANGLTGTIPQVQVMPVLSDFQIHRNVGWKELNPVQVSSLGSTTVDTTLGTARDGDASTDWECLTGTGDVCNILLDFGRPVCLEKVRIQESGVLRTPNPTTFAMSKEGVDGCPLTVNIYQGSTGFAKSSITEEMIWRSWDDDRSWRHGYNWQTCAPSTWRTIGRERRTDAESSCWEGAQGEGGGWDPYCRDRTQYYRIQIAKCSTPICKLAEIKFYEGERMSGTIPPLPPTLNNFYAYGNMLTGTIPLVGPLWGQDLRVSDNWLEGPLPAFCPSFTNLDRLWIDHNRLSGTLPDEDCMSEVVSMRVGHNLLTGTIPPCPCGVLTEYFLDGNACCLLDPAMSPPQPGHKSWRDEALTKIKDIGHYTVCPRFDSEQCTGGLVGRLPDFTTMPRLERFGADNNNLRGPLDESLKTLTRLEWFRVRHNKIAGTLPIKAIIEAGNGSTDCNEMSWEFTNNTLWGPVPDLPLPLTTACLGSWNGCHGGWRRDGRKFYDFSIDYNNLWGPLPSRFERVRDNVRVKHNCWDCQITEQAVWGPPLNPDAPGVPGSTWTSAGFGEVKELTDPPDCGEGKGYAERYPLDGPSCPAETPFSLYEHVDRCSPLFNITAIFTEEEIRSGSVSFEITFAAGSPLPFFAPGLWRCTLCDDAQGTKDDCSSSLCPHGPFNATSSTASCPIDPNSSSCPIIPYVVWPWGGTTCPIGVNASCPTDVCLPCTISTGVPDTLVPETPAPPTLAPLVPPTSSPTAIPATVAPDTPAPPLCGIGFCPQSFACELNSICPFGVNGSTYNDSAAGCTITQEVIHAPNGSCVVSDNGTCPFAACNYPWSCDTTVTSLETAWGPYPLNFSQALKQLFYDGINTSVTHPYQVNERGFNTYKNNLVSTSGFALGPIPGADPWVDLPTSLVVTLNKVPEYDVSVEELMDVTMWDELLLAPFGETFQNGGIYAGGFQIVPSAGLMSGIDANVSEDVVRGKDFKNKPVSEVLTVSVSLPHNSEVGGWETWRCGANYSDECTYFNTIQPGPEAPRTCNFECATETPQAGLTPNISMTHCSEYEMEFDIRLPSYEMADLSTEIVEMIFTGNCTASGLPPLNNVVIINVWSGIDPEPTPTVTITPPITDTHTLTMTASLSQSASVTTSVTATAIPLCVFYPDSTFCIEHDLSYGLSPLMLLAATVLGICLALCMFLLCPKRKKEQVQISVESPDCTVFPAVPVAKPIEIGVSKVPESDVTIGVTKVEEDVMVGVSKVKEATNHIAIHGVKVNDDVMVSGTKMPFESEWGDGRARSRDSTASDSATRSSKSTKADSIADHQSLASQPLLGSRSRSLISTDPRAIDELLGSRPGKSDTHILL